MQYLNCRLVSEKIEPAGYDGVGLPGLECVDSPLTIDICRTMAESYRRLNMV